MLTACRWAESHRKWPDGKPWYEDPYGALWVGACIPEEQQAKMKAWKEQVSLFQPNCFGIAAAGSLTFVMLRIDHSVLIELIASGQFFSSCY